MKKEVTEMDGCFLLKFKNFQDSRGSFLKIFNSNQFMDIGLEFSPKECFVSVSHRAVIRGLHFQLPPHHHTKVVICLKGQAFDVIVDLRKDSPSFKKHLSFNLKEDDPTALFIPPGLAHGFQAIEADTQMLYFTDIGHVPMSDSGIRWDSCNIRWPLSDTVLSDRDASFPTLKEFNTPFSYL